MTFNHFEDSFQGLGDKATSGAKNLQDVLEWLERDECPLGVAARRTYAQAVRKAARLIGRTPDRIPACTTQFQSMFPNRDYARSWGKTFCAAKRWKRNVSAAINGATGIIAAQKERRARRDQRRRRAAARATGTRAPPTRRRRRPEGTQVAARRLGHASGCAAGNRRDGQSLSVRDSSEAVDLCPKLRGYRQKAGCSRNRPRPGPRFVPLPSGPHESGKGRCRRGTRPHRPIPRDERSAHRELPASTAHWLRSARAG